MRHAEVNENINKTISTRITGLENWADLAEENSQEKNPTTQKDVFQSGWPGLKDANQHFCSTTFLLRLFHLKNDFGSGEAELAEIHMLQWEEL